MSSDLPELIKEIRTVSEDYFHKQQTNNFKLNRNRCYIKTLQKENNIVILKSNKGNSLVVQTSISYIA